MRACLVASIFVASLSAAPFPARAQCLLCAPAEPKPPERDARPLRIEVETALDFSRAAQRGGGGTIRIDPQSGGRTVQGLVDLGGVAVKGTVRLTGEPMRRIRVALPASAQLTASDGGTAEVVDLTSDLPLDAMLDAGGRLAFAFGGRLRVSAAVSGELRGRIPIVADYQ